MQHAPMHPAGAYRVPARKLRSMPSPSPAAIPGGMPCGSTKARRYRSHACQADAMTRRPLLTSNWDSRRQELSYKVAIEGTGKHLLFTVETLRDLQSQIDAALKGPDRVDSA